MATADLFSRLGLFIARDFLDDDVRRTICAEMRAAASEQSAMRTGSGDFGVNAEFRRSRWAKVSDPTLATVREKLLDAKPDLEKHFAVALRDCEEPQFLLYTERDFYRPHKDSTSDRHAAEYLRQRRVSVVIFLNQETDENRPESYSGGALTFYGLLDAAPLKGRALRLDGEASLCVGFRSDVTHEVTPVTRGERLTIVSWFF